MSEVMRITKAAAYLDLTEGALHNAVQSESVPFHRDGRRLLFLKEDLDLWLSRLPGTSVSDALRHVLQKPHSDIDVSLVTSTDTEEIPHIAAQKRGPQLSFKERHKHIFGG